MLMELSIRDFAIIPSLTVRFHEGFNVLTGETGAGKSILIDAVSLLIGGRAHSDYVRYGQNKAEIEGLFDVTDHVTIHSLLQELGIEGDDDTLILRRDISKQGKNVCRVNGKLVTLGILREIGQLLVDIHGQHEHQHLLVEEKHLQLLDEYGKETIRPHLQEYQQLFTKLKKVDQTIEQLTNNEQQMVQRLDLLRFQKQEISAAGLEPGEDDQLQAEKQKRLHAQKLYEGIEFSYQAVYGDGRALDSVGLMMNQLEELVHIDENLSPTLEKVQSMYYQLEDVSHELSAYRDTIEFDSQRLNDVENRLVEIDKLKRKYGPTVDAILEYGAKVEDELDALEHKEDRLDDWHRQRDEIISDLVIEADHLSQLRKQIAKQLEQQIKEELQGLYMDQTEIEVQLQPLTKGKTVQNDHHTYTLNQHGTDAVQILIAPNPGEPLKPLIHTASGGELSRFMLALKTVFSKLEPVTTLIFDEVDTGVSGRVAGAMAEKLYKISTDQQVLCITHQPQVAALGDQHYRLVKHVHDQQTETEVLSLSSSESMRELARMMSGIQMTASTEQHAVDLKQSAEKVKKEVMQSDPN